MQAITQCQNTIALFDEYFIILALSTVNSRDLHVSDFNQLTFQGYQSHTSPTPWHKLAVQTTLHSIKVH